LQAKFFITRSHGCRFLAQQPKGGLSLQWSRPDRGLHWCPPLVLRAQPLPRQRLWGRPV